MIYPVSTTLKGLVVQERVAEGSKSEHRAVILKAESGITYWLRRQGGPSFGDEALEALVGETIEADGLLRGHLFLIENWRVSAE